MGNEAVVGCGSDSRGTYEGRCWSCVVAAVHQDVCAGYKPYKFVHSAAVRICICFRGCHGVLPVLHNQFVVMPQPTTAVPHLRSQNEARFLVTISGPKK